MPTSSMIVYFEQSDRYVSGTDRRILELFTQFISSFGSNYERYTELASKISDNERHSEQQREMLRAGMFDVADVLSYCSKESGVQTFPIGLKNALLEKLRKHEISTDFGSFLKVQVPDVQLNKGIVTAFHNLDCLDNAICGTQYVLEKYRSSVLHITVRDSDGNEHGGTGFLARYGLRTPFERILILTNKHVVDPGRWVIEKIETGGVPIRHGRVHVDQTYDLAAIEVVDAKPAPALVLLPSFHILEKVIVLGYPYVARVNQSVLMAHSGEINGYSPTRDGEDVFFMSASISPGSSGGPVLNEIGLVVGLAVQSHEGLYQRVMAAKDDDISTIRTTHHAAIPADAVIKFLDRLPATVE